MTATKVPELPGIDVEGWRVRWPHIVAALIVLYLLHRKGG